MTCSAFATIRRQKFPCEYMGWSVEHDSPRWTSDRLSAAPVPLEILIDELNKVAAREVNVWAVVYPQNASGQGLAERQFPAPDCSHDILRQEKSLTSMDKGSAGDEPTKIEESENPK